MHLFDYSTMFDDITVAERQLLMLSESVVYFRKGEVLFNEGDKATDLFCLVEGRVKLFKAGMDRVQIVRLVPKYDCFGYPAAFNGGVHRISAMAMTDVTLIKVPMNVVRKIIQGNSKVGFNFIKALSGRLGSIDSRIVSLTQKHVRGRLAETLLHVIDAYEQDNNSSVFECDMSREEIASLANMTTATAIRTLSAFRDEGVVEYVGRNIRIVDCDKLEKISNMG